MQNDRTHKVLPALSVVHSYPAWLPLTQTWMYHLIKALGRRVTCSVVCENIVNANVFELPDITSLQKRAPRAYVVQYLLRKCRLIRQLNLFSRTVRERAPAIVHSHFGNFGWRDSRAVKKLGLVHAVTFYGADLSMLARKKLWQRRYAELFRTVDAVFCEGPFMARTAQALGAPEAITHVQPLGVDLSALPYRPRSWDGSRPLRVLIAASFRPKKGVPDAVRALSQAAKHIDIEATIVGDAAGDAESVAEKDRILEALRAGRLEQRVAMTGFMDFKKLFALSYEHDLFIQASRTAPNGDSEGGAPVTLIEFAAGGMPIVSTRHCDIPFVLEHQRSAFLAEEGDGEGIAKGIVWWANRAGDWSGALGAARRRIEQQFDLQTQADRLVDHYAMLANG